MYHQDFCRYSDMNCFELPGPTEHSEDSDFEKSRMTLYISHSAQLTDNGIMFDQKLTSRMMTRSNCFERGFHFLSAAAICYTTDTAGLNSSNIYLLALSNKNVPSEEEEEEEDGSRDFQSVVDIVFMYVCMYVSSLRTKTRPSLRIKILCPYTFGTLEFESHPPSPRRGVALFDLRSTRSPRRRSASSQRRSGTVLVSWKLSLRFFASLFVLSDVLES